MGCWSRSAAARERERERTGAVRWPVDPPTDRPTDRPTDLYTTMSQLSALDPAATERPVPGRVEWGGRVVAFAAAAARDRLHCVSETLNFDLAVGLLAMSPLCRLLFFFFFFSLCGELSVIGDGDGDGDGDVAASLAQALRLFAAAQDAGDGSDPVGHSDPRTGKGERGLLIRRGEEILHHATPRHATPRHTTPR